MARKLDGLVANKTFSLALLSVRPVVAISHESHFDLLHFDSEQAFVHSKLNMDGYTLCNYEVA